MAMPITRAEREALWLAHAPLDGTVALECGICRYVRVVESGGEVACRHGGEWIPMRIAKDQTAARARAKTQCEAWEAQTAEQLTLEDGER